jgi:hypothetical protein
MAAWTEYRTSTRRRYCGPCGGVIRAGERYRRDAATPGHDGGDGERWWVIVACLDCGERHGDAAQVAA